MEERRSEHCISKGPIGAVCRKICGIEVGKAKIFAGRTSSDTKLGRIWGRIRADGSPLSKSNRLETPLNSIRIAESDDLVACEQVVLTVDHVAEARAIRQHLQRSTSRPTEQPASTRHKQFRRTPLARA